MQTLQNKEVNNIKQRENYLDWICGLMILQMIFGHVLSFAGLGNQSGWFEANHILSFFMPWFFFKSGMFFNPAKSWDKTLKSSWKRLMVPFIVFSIIGYVIFVSKLFFFRHDVVWKWYLGGITYVFSKGNILENGPLWYLLSLFIIKIAYWLCCLKNIKDWIILPLCAIIPTVMYYTGHNEWLLMSHTLLGMFFFICGYRLKNIQFDKYAFYISVASVISILLLQPSSVDMYHSNLEYGSYILYFIYSVAAVVVINNLIKITPPICY